MTTPLPELLQLKLDNLKDTPLDEPKVFELIKETENKSKLKMVRHFLTDDEIMEYPASTIGDFVHAVEEKITGLQLGDGVFKSTPNTENCELPNFLEADELTEIGKEEHALRMRLQDPKVPVDEKQKIWDEFSEVTTRLQKRLFEISKLDIEVLTDWEKTLVGAMVYHTALDATKSAMGKR